MLGSRTILIVDENGYDAFDLSQAIEESEGCVAGPVATLAETMVLLDCADLGGAIVDFELAEASQIVMLLAKRNVPVVVQISSHLPPSQCQFEGGASVLVRPVEPHTVLQSLLMEIGKSEPNPSNGLGFHSKEV